MPLSMQYKHTVTLKPSRFYPMLVWALFVSTTILLLLSFTPVWLKAIVFLGMCISFVLALQENGLHGKITTLVFCASESRVDCLFPQGTLVLQEVSFPLITTYLLMMRGRQDGRWRAVWLMRDSLPATLPYQYTRARAGHATS